jgi:hypothetical protein
MRIVIVLAALAWCACARSAPTGPADAFEQLQSLAGEWEADFPGVGKLTNLIRLVSNGKAIEETIGNPADNEISVYTRDDQRILMTHFCAMTPDGHQVRLVSARLNGLHDSLAFAFIGATNLHSNAAPHMTRMVMTLTDHDHISEKWTKSEGGKDTVFDLKFVRRSH